MFIYTAGPKKGNGILCPSCYADCSKRATTDNSGNFTIPSVDSNLTFRLLIVASGHESTFASKVDPAAGPVEVTLQKRTAEMLSSPHRITGIVMNEAGDPVPGAVISTEGIERGSGTQWGGTDAFADPIAVSDLDGIFFLLCKPDVRTVHSLVQAPGVAKRWVALNAGNDHVISMVEGVNITGKLARHGQPVAGVVVGLSTVDRTCGSFLHEFEATTDKEGQFLLTNVTPDNEYCYYTKMESMPAQTALPAGTVRAGKSGTTVALGKLMLQPGHRIQGRVVLSDGKRIPSQTRLLLARERAWDHTETTLDSEGRFDLTGVPGEPVGLSVRVKGYKLSKKNPSLDWLNGGIVGTVDRDIADFTILLEPGEWRFRQDDDDQPSGRESQPYDKPLRGFPNGVEASASAP